MTNLSRNPDGSYRGTYKGREFTVRKETVANRGEVWVARAGTIVATGWKNNSRDDMVGQLQRQLDEAVVTVPPKIDAILRRWAEEIKAVVPRLDLSDQYTADALESLRLDLKAFEREFRRAAIRVEEGLAALKAREQRRAGGGAA